MWKAVDVWKRLGDGGIARYRCFAVLPKGGYCVQSVDFFSTPLNQSQCNFLEQQYLELLLEQDPDQRAKVYSSLEEAIDAHEREFGEDASSDESIELPKTP